MLFMKIILDVIQVLKKVLIICLTLSPAAMWVWKKVFDLIWMPDNDLFFRGTCINFYTGLAGIHYDTNMDQPDNILNDSKTKIVVFYYLSNAFDLICTFLEVNLRKYRSKYFEIKRVTLVYKLVNPYCSVRCTRCAVPSTHNACCHLRRGKYQQKSWKDQSKWRI